MTSSQTPDQLAKLTAFFEVLDQKLRHFREMSRHMDRYLATRFNTLALFAPLENKLSDIIADMLRPDGTHGQGAAFLDAFLELVVKLSDLRGEDLVSVIRESPTSYTGAARRRIDVLVTLRTPVQFGIAIENKPWAGEQDYQLQDYQRELQSRFGTEYCLVYLAGTAGEPNSIDPTSLHEDRGAGRFVHVHYGRAFLSWLKECARRCEADRYRWFLLDFIAWTQDRFPEYV